MNTNIFKEELTLDLLKEGSGQDCKENKRGIQELITAHVWVNLGLPSTAHVRVNLGFASMAHV